MLAGYRRVFATPGARSFCAAAFVMRLPLAIYPIGLVLIISARDGRYQFAGVLSACYIAGNCVGHPLLARLVDRYGQRRVIHPACVAHVVSVVALALLVRARAADPALVLPAFAAGLSYLDTGSLVRARWSHVLAGRAELTTAYSVESTLDELIFIIGPLVATLIATQLTPVLVLYLALALVIAGGARLAALRSTEPPPHAASPGRRPPVLRQRGMTLLCVAGAFMGAVFASAEVSMVAFCGQHHHRGLSGVVLAAMAGGSAVAGFVYGARPRTAPLLLRLRHQAIVFAVLPAVLFAAPNVPALVPCAFVVGLGIAPLLITSFGLIERIAPPGSLTEALAWFSTGLNAGYGAGAAVVGGIADAAGARAAFAVAVGAAVCVGLTGTGLYRQLRPVDVPLIAS